MGSLSRRIQFALIRFLIGTYPRAWQDRYRGEIEALVELTGPTLRAAGDLLRGSALEWARTGADVAFASRESDSWTVKTFREILRKTAGLAIFICAGAVELPTAAAAARAMGQRIGDVTFVRGAALFVAVTLMALHLIRLALILDAQTPADQPETRQSRAIRVATIIGRSIAPLWESVRLRARDVAWLSASAWCALTAWRVAFPPSTLEASDALMFIQLGMIVGLTWPSVSVFFKGLAARDERVSVGLRHLGAKRNS